MNLFIFSVHDEAAGAYMTPFFLPTAELAKRVFAECVNNPEHQFGKSTGDYTLFSIGIFNQIDGSIECDIPRSLGNGLNFINKKED